MTAEYQPYTLNFKRPAGTSRGELLAKETFILKISDGVRTGIGECALFRGLSYDDVPAYEEKLRWLCTKINENFESLRSGLKDFPSIIFGLEQALLNLKHGTDLYFPSEFTEGKKSIKINGLIWMGSAEFMQQQIQEKLDGGYDCLKLKIGVNWPSERDILKKLRQKFPADILEIRVDANGGFSFEEAQNVLQELSTLKIHSIEQPIKAGQIPEMAKLCAETPTPIALDEELIGVIELKGKKSLLKEIMPQFLILKPSLVGGFSGTNEWIQMAENQNIGWWMTSALESNIGLNAIAQYAFTKNPKIPQGLGTGALFTNNFATRLRLERDRMWH